MKPADIFQSHMVLQRNKPVFIWGIGETNEKVTACIQHQSASTVTDQSGKWCIELPPLSESENETLTIRSENEEILLQDIAVGEVFIAAGQSNMEFWMRYEKHFAEEKPCCQNPMIRFYDVPEVTYAGQDQDFDFSESAVWRQASPDELQYFSAVGYFFAKEMQASLHVPVGIIGCNFGGTSASVWMSRDTLRTYGTFYLDEYEAWEKDTDLKAYWKKQRVNPMNDRGMPFRSPFNDFILPRTPSPDEIEGFFAQAPASDVAPDFSLRKPESIPCTLFEHMVKAIAPFRVSGVLWYQGESDDEKDHTELYEGLLKGLIKDWRELWKEKLPFFIVQLPGWRSWMGFGGKNWMTIRAAQEKVCRDDDLAFLVSISDAGEEYDIHPKNKKVVGQRLAWSALGHLYEKKLLCDPPRLVQAKRQGCEILLVFGNAGEGLYIIGDKINALELIENGKSIPFSSEVKEDTVILTPACSAEQPLEIQFAQSMWYQVNLFGSSGIPVIPFKAAVE